MIAGLGVLAALAFVLGLMAFAVWSIKRLGASGPTGGRSRLAVEVVQRLPLGPKSGLAIVRVGEKVLAVSMGDGGVHTLFEVDEVDRQRIVANSQIPVPLASSTLAESEYKSAITGALMTPWQRFFGAQKRLEAMRKGTSSPDFSGQFSSALRKEPALAAPAVSAGLGDLSRALSMTLAPSTRLS